jgi:hypothetical protein
LSVGYREYRQEDGVLVEADGTFLLEETAGPLNDPLHISDVAVVPFNSESGVIFFATISGGNMLSGNTISGYLTYSQ